MLSVSTPANGWNVQEAVLEMVRIPSGSAMGTKTALKKRTTATSIIRQQAKRLLYLSERSSECMSRRVDLSRQKYA